VTRAAVQASKRALRRAWLPARATSPARDVRALACQEHLLGLPELATCRTIALYSATGHEVPVERVGAALRARGLAVVLPRMTGPELELELHRVTEPAKLVRGAFGLLEPAPSAPVVPAREVDLFAVPGVAFDRAGNRLGRGGGHYDRLLARARADAPRVGLCYGERLLDELPIDEWDIPMCVVVTEGGALRIRSSERPGHAS
jgi:5-formyltetrahydrofolate cyclo-ligase